MIRYLLAALLGITAVPAQAADIATIGCVEDHLTADGLTLLNGDIVRVVEHAAAGGNGPTPPMSDEAKAAMVRATAPCVETHGWSPAAVRFSILYTVGKLTAPLADRALRGRGMNPDAIVAIYEEAPQEQRNRMFDASLYALVTGRLVSAGVLESTTDPRGYLVGTMLGALNLMSFGRAEFIKA